MEDGERKLVYEGEEENKGIDKKDDILKRIYSCGDVSSL